MYFANGIQNDDFLFNGVESPNSCEEKIIGGKIVNELKLEPQIKNMFQKVAQNQMQAQKNFQEMKQQN